MLSLIELHKEALLNEYEALNRIKHSPNDEIQVKSDIGMLWNYNQTFALHAFFVERDIIKFKQCMFICGSIDTYLIKRYDFRILDSGVSNLLYSVLSDSNSLMQNYANLGHSKYNWMVENGHSTLLYAIQQVIKEDWEKVNWSLEIMAKKNKKLNQVLLPDRLFFEGMTEKDEHKVNEAIGKLLRDHKKRNKYLGIAQEYISMPALGYAKLAWRNGLKIEVQNPLVPDELLPYDPIDNYDVKYDFLKAIR